MTQPQNRKAIPQAGIVCGTCDTEFRSPALQCQSCTKCSHPTCAKIPLYHMVKYAQSTIQFPCKQCTEQLVEPHWTDTAHLFRDCYINSINIENRYDLNDTEVPTEESRIESQTVYTEEKPNKREEKERSQSDDNEHETHQAEPTSRVAARATTEEPQNKEHRQRLRKINAVCNFYKKKACRLGMIGEECKFLHSPHAENIWKSRNKLQSTMKRLPSQTLQVF